MNYEVNNYINPNFLQSNNKTLIATKHRLIKSKTIDELAIFKENVYSYLDKNKIKSRFIKDNIESFIELLNQLLIHQNHPLNRQGKEKALFIQEWLKKHKIKSEIIKTKNQDPTKIANKDNCWYSVQAVIGDKNYKSGVNGMMVLHHDQVKKDTKEIIFRLSSNHNKIYHPWILDSTIQLVAGLFEAINFNKWWLLNKHKPNLRGRIKLVVTDGEEQNTLGMRGVLKQWEKVNDLAPLDFCIVGEASSYRINGGESNSRSLPCVGYINRGKSTSFANGTSNKSIEQLFNDFFIKFTIANSYVYTISNYNNNALHNEKLKNTYRNKVLLSPTAISTTYGHIEKLQDLSSLTAFIESRTNTVVDTIKSEVLLDQIMGADANYINNLYKVIKMHMDMLIKKEKSFIDIKTNMNEVILTITKGDAIHPGAYNPLKFEGVLPALFLLLNVLPDEAKNKITHIEWGDEKTPNSVPNKAKIHFDIDIQLEKIKLNKRRIKFDKIDNLTTFKIAYNKLVPKREALEVPINNWDIVDTAIQSLEASFKKELNINSTLKAVPFDAMHDGAAISAYPEIRRKLLSKGENILTIGIGSLKNLHGDEYLTIEDFLVGMVMYKDIIKSLFIDRTKNAH